MALHPLEAEVAAVAERTPHLSPGAAVVVAVSGGPDSVALLRALVAADAEGGRGWTLHVAHLNHGLRGQASDGDAAFVQGLSRELGLTSHLATKDVAALAGNTGQGIEEAARQARYRFLQSVAAETAAAAVAVGHQADDQVETVLHRAFRGTGVRGLAGMAEVRPLAPGSPTAVVRPLLGVWRREVVAYLDAIGQTYRLDATNRDPAFQRNWLRHVLLPLVQEQYGGHAKFAVQRLAKVAAAVGTDLRDRAEACLGEMLVRREEGLVELAVEPFAALSPALREPVLRLAWRAVGLGEGSMGYDAWERVAQLALAGRPNAQLDLPGAVVKCSRGRLVVARADVTPREAAAPGWDQPLPVPGRVDVGEAGLRVSVSEPMPAAAYRAKEGSDDHWEEWVDADRVRLPLRVRCRASGDVFHPLGAPGRRKLKRFLIDHKVPADRRSRTALVVDREGIVWVVGHRIDERVKITPATRSVLKVSARPSDPA